MSQATGIMRTVLLSRGKKLEKGDLLLVIHPRPDLGHPRKSRRSPLANLCQFKIQPRKNPRYSKLVQEDYVSEARLRPVCHERDLRRMKPSHQTNQADVETAKIDLGYCYITSPVNGVTGKLTVKPGNYVAATANTALTIVNQLQSIAGFFCPRKRFEPDSE